MDSEEIYYFLAKKQVVFGKSLRHTNMAATFVKLHFLLFQILFHFAFDSLKRQRPGQSHKCLTFIKHHYSWNGLNLIMPGNMLLLINIYFDDN